VYREEQRALYGLGECLLRLRLPVALVISALTGLFAWRATHLSMAMSLDDLLPQNHPFIQVHNRYSAEFGGANTITIMLEAKTGNVFTPERLAQIALITDAVDKIAGIDHNQIDSIAHRTTRRLSVGSGGTLRSEPLMSGVNRVPQSEKEAAAIRRAVHNTESVYGRLVSLDDKATIVRASFVKGRLDYRRIFDELDERVLVPYVNGWTGAQIESVQPANGGQLDTTELRVEHVFPGGAAENAGLQKGDLITSLNGAAVRDAWALGATVAAAQGTGIEIGYLRGGSARSVTLSPKPSDLEVYVAGEPRLYGWVYRHANGVYWILAAAALGVWISLYLYYRDWRGALRPTLTAAVAGLWGLGFMELSGFALNPLTLVIPFFITARAVSHSVQMHDRYYEEFATNGFRKRRAILGTFSALFVPTLTGVMTDAAGVLMLLLVPIPMLQQLAVTAAFWILAIAVAELVLNPIVFDAVKAPREAIVYKRAAGRFNGVLSSLAVRALSPGGRLAIFGVWIALAVGCATQWSKITIGDPSAASPLLEADATYNDAHRRIQAKFGGVEPLWVVVEGRDRDAVKDPGTLARMEQFQRWLERDRAVGSSFSIADVARSVNALAHELEPKWGVLPDRRTDTGALFFLFFSGAAPSETARYVTGDYQAAPITFFARDHRGETVRRIIDRAERFIEANPLQNARFRLGGGMIGVLAAANEQLLRNDVLVTVLVYAAVFGLVLFTYRSFAAAFLLLVPLALSNMVVNAYIGLTGMGLNLNTLPVIALGVGFGIDFGLYLVSRTIEVYHSLGGRYPADERTERLYIALSQAIATTGKTISFTSLTMILASFFWCFSAIRFNAEMGLLLGLWMTITWIASLTLLPVLLYVFQPEFVRRVPSRPRAVSHQIATANTF